MNGTKEALKFFVELTDDVEVLLNKIENMPRPITNGYNEIVGYDDTYTDNYILLDEFICSSCDGLYEKYEKIFSFFKVNYELEENGKYNIEVEAEIELNEYYDGYGKLTFYNQFNN